MDRKDCIQKLEEIIQFDGKVFNAGNMAGSILLNTYTYKLCQVVEVIGVDGTDTPMGRHVHKNSREIFYQLEGETIFEDGINIKSGEIRVVEPGEIHSPKMTEGGSCIIIIHPVEELYPKGN